MESVDPIKLQQAFARTTAEILAGSQVPLRRLKAEQEEKEFVAMENMSENEKKAAEEAKKNKQPEVELTVWLKDFPKTAADFRELRRSAAQH